MNPTSIETIVAADVFQIVVVSIGMIIFLYVRLACGPPARYFVHFAFGYLIIGLLYAFNAITEVYFHFSGHVPSLETKAILQMTDSSLSLLNTAFFFTAWQLMRDLRQHQQAEDRRAPSNAETTDTRYVIPAMTKGFIGGVIGALVVGIAAYIGTAQLIIEHRNLQILFSVIDVSLAAIVAVLLASEFFMITLVPDAEGGVLFTSRWSHLILRGITALLFFAFGVFQFSYLFSFMKNPPAIFAYPSGQAYQVLAALKILCAGAAGILGIHALPSVRWKHGTRLLPVGQEGDARGGNRAA